MTEGHAPSEGYRALRHSAAWIDCSARGRIAVRGRDRVRLIHNLTTNDVKRLGAGSGCYAFLLNPQGRIQADLSLLVFPDRFLIETEPELGEKVQAYIRRYIIADQVELENTTAQTASVAIEGPDAAAVLNAPRRTRAGRRIRARGLGRRDGCGSQPDRPARLPDLPAGSGRRRSSQPHRSRWHTRRHSG